MKVIADNVLVTPRRLEALSKIDTQHIYVENIRALLGSTSWAAKIICETAVRQGIFAKKIQFLCPGGGARTFDQGQQIPETISYMKEVDDGLELVNEATARMDKIEFYAFVRGVA